MHNFFTDPILNSPYDRPDRHWNLDAEGRPTGEIENKRRTASFIAAVPGSRADAQGDLLDLDELGDEHTLQTAINEMRHEIDRWRSIPNPDDWGVTPETKRLLQHWRDPNFEGLRPFFCQVEAAEAAIWLAEVAPRRARTERFLNRVRDVSATANPDLIRIALKLATGAGKTTVMAMLIAWQTINKVRNPRSRKFTKGFLIIAPGITIRERLRVLQPNDPESYYWDRGLVPAEMLGDMREARIVITNYHAFRLKDDSGLTPGGRRALAGHGNAPETAETEAEMVRRVCGSLYGLGQIMVINDEAHHCYRPRPEAAEEERGRSDEAREAKANNDQARLWISGVEAVARQIGLLNVYDLSATPFFLSGSGYPAGTIFPWVVSDFSLIDAIECGVVKLPRVPVSDNLPTGQTPLYRNLWPAVRERMPAGTRGNRTLDPQSLPIEVKTAIDALYGHYERTYADWKTAEVGVPPVFIIVCANTAASELVAEYIAGYNRTDEHEETHFHKGRCELFWNYSEFGEPLSRPNTLLIDSIQIDSGEAIDDAFRKAAAQEIEQFRQEKAKREGAEAARTITEADILREVMNTVGQRGRLGEQVRCVVSVGMLTEGWDANTVTHILGLRAFGSRLLCEQVMGRALRRLHYTLHDTEVGPRFEVEYADIMGIDGLNLAPQDAVRSTPTRARPMVRVEAVSPERDDAEIRFPRVDGYRIELPETRLEADWAEVEDFVLTPALTGPCEVEMRGVVGAPETLDMSHLQQVRDNEVIAHLTGHIVFQKLRDEEGQPVPTLIPQVKKLVRHFYDNKLRATGQTVKQQVMHLQLADDVASIIIGAINRHHAETEHQPIRALLAPYAPVGSTFDVGLNTGSENRHAPNPLRSHINWIIYDSGWEKNLAERLDSHPRVIAYAKNHGLGFEVPYRSGNLARRYRPDFIVRIDDGSGGEINLVLEVKGFRDHDAMLKADTMRQQWVPGVNRLGRFGRWAFDELREIHEFGPALDAAIMKACGEPVI